MSNGFESWLGGGGDLDSIRSSSHRESDVPIEGWRRRCLFILIAFLIFVIIINFAITLWIIKVMDFSLNGMGRLSILSEGVKLNGNAYVMHSLLASYIKTSNKRPLTMQGYHNITIRNWNEDGELLSGIHLGPESLNTVASSFSVLDPDKNLLFYADKNRLEVASKKFSISGDGGIVFNTSIQTPVITSPTGKNLRIESVTRGLHIDSTEAVTLESRAGEISATSLDHLTLEAKGEILLTAESIRMPGLPTVTPDNPDTTQKNIYQVCVCKKGKIFFAPPDQFCAAQAYICH